MFETRQHFWKKVKHHHAHMKVTAASYKPMSHHWDTAQKTEFLAGEGAQKPPMRIIELWVEEKILFHYYP